MRKDKSKTDNMHSFSGSKYRQMQKTRKPASRDGLPVCIFSRRPLSPAGVQRSIERPRRFSSILLRFQVPHRPPQRFVCSHQTIVCCRQTIVCSHQTMVCCHQTTKRLDGGKRKRGDGAPDAACRAANFTLLFRNTIKGTKRRELNARQTSESILKGTIRRMVFTLYAAKTQYFKAKAGLGRKIVGPLQRQANERSRRPLLYILKNQQR